MPTAARPAWTYDALLLVTVVIWGVNFLVLKAVLGVMDPHAVNVVRFSVSALVLGGLYAARQDGTAFFAPLRTHGRQIAGLGFLAYVAYQLAFIIGLDHTTAGSAALIMGAAPLWTALFARLLGTEHLPVAAWGALGATFAGTIVVVLGGSKVAGGTLFGNGIMLAGAVVWGGYTALNKRVVDAVSPLAVAFFGVLTALPFLYAVGVPTLPAVDWARVTPLVWAALVFSGGLSTGIAFVIWNLAVKHVGASHTAAYNNLVPFVALVGGWLVLAEAVAWPQLVGGALIIGGLVTLRRSRRRQRERLHT